MTSSSAKLTTGRTKMKIDAICKDAHGAEATVVVDLDYVDTGSYDEVHEWCANELHEEQLNRFDAYNFDIINYDEISSSCMS